MYQSILNQKLKIQTRISWKNETKEKSNNSPWIDKLYDIWFASKSNDYLINDISSVRITNFWDDIIQFKHKHKEKHPKELIKRMLHISKKI